MQGNPEALLKSLGLTEYETRAWLVLLRHGTLTAERISELGGIPLPRVYDTITELQRKGFVITSKGRPKKFKAIEAKRALSSFIEVQRRDLNRKVDELKLRAGEATKILVTIEPEMAVAEEKWDVWTTEKRTNINKVLDDLKKSAKSEITIFSGDLSWIHEASREIKDAIRRGLKVRIIMRSPEGNKDIKNNITKATQLGVKVRTGYTGPLRAHVIDEKIVAVINKIPIKSIGTDTGIPGVDHEFQYVIVTITNPSIVKALKENFEFWWKILGK